MNGLPKVLLIVGACVLALPLVAFLRGHMRTIATSVAEWIAYCLRLVTTDLQAAADGTRNAVDRARHGIIRNGWPVWPLIAALIAVSGAFLFVRSEYYLVMLTAKAIFAPSVYDPRRGWVPPSHAEVEMATSVAWVFVGGTLVLGGLPFVLADDHKDPKSRRVGPLDGQPESVKRAVTRAVYVLSVVAVLGSMVLGCYRAYLAGSGSGVMDGVAAYAAGAGTATITSVGSLAVGWAVDYALMGTWLLIVAVLHLGLRVVLLPVKMASDLAQRNAAVITPAAVDAMARLGATANRRGGTAKAGSDARGEPYPPAQEFISSGEDVDGPVYVVPPGSTFAGRWQVVGNLPNADTPGYAAAVMLCRDLSAPGTPADFVIKLLSKEQQQNAKEWRRELEAASRVHSDWAVPVLDSGVTTKWLWMITPHYVPGSLAVNGRTLVRSRNLDWCLAMVEKLLWGLQAVHEQRIAHLDIKPQNVLLSWEDPEHGVLRPALADFGLAKQFSEQDLSQSFRPRGTPFYMPYEQMTVDRRRDDRSPLSDIYAMGSLLYWLISGKPALAREAQALTDNPDRTHIKELMERDHRPARLDALVTGLPVSVADLADRWLAHDPAQRVDQVEDKTPAECALLMLVAMRNELLRSDPNALRMPVGQDVALDGLPATAGQGFSEESGPGSYSEESYGSESSGNGPSGGGSWSGNPGSGPSGAGFSANGAPGSGFSGNGFPGGNGSRRDG
ncbi:protein kinase domain-containing protein [Actinacidiphila acididurans]|uniref:non-specific serine/threonine protein kinase n=1 Tax=Actinacidiphila acididurans TaxID=2784346 RepID=A0ABS2U172_9ACTN|nr:protein kinase [Actinacidiphila acididurans]MBM9509097.1 protein kinase [Actinacidiphila acididurans]